MDQQDINKDNKYPRKFFGHPGTLRTLFMTEFWERFSYYGMRAILLYYMYTAISQGGLGLDVKLATSIMAIYGSLVYMTSAIGGYVSDRLIGSAKSVLYGGILIMMGHIFLSMPMRLNGLILSIIFITIGTGLLKPNVSETVGSLYVNDPHKRDSAFSIFVMGINLGSLIAPLVVSFVGQTYNYHMGFLLAAIGMGFGLIGYILQIKNLPVLSKTVTNPLTKAEKNSLIKKLTLAIVFILIVLLALKLTNLLTANAVILIFTIIGIFLPVYYLINMFNSKKVTKTEKLHLKAYLPLFICEILFCIIVEQGGVVLALFAEDQTQLNIGSLHLQAGQFQSLNPLFIIIYSPIFAILWTKLGKHQPSAPTKFALSLIFSGLSFAVMAIPVALFGASAKVSPLWLVLSWAILEIGELLISPIGLSITSQLSPKAFKSQMMSMWFLGNACAQAFNSQIVRLYTPNNEVMYFSIIGVVSIIAAFVLLALTPKIKALINA